MLTRIHKQVFHEINDRVGVCNELIEICVAYMICTKENREQMKFQSPQPTLENLLENPNIPEIKKQNLTEFINQNKKKGLDTDLLSFLVAYIGIFLERDIQVILDRKHLAMCLNMDLQSLSFIATAKYKKNSGYRRIKIPKKQGSFREIQIPNPKIKSIQRWILDNILSKIPIHESAHGFRSGRSILTNANVHVDKKIIINLDLKDFFPSITYNRIFGLFINIGYPKKVTELLTNLCTNNGRLPQGAPTRWCVKNCGLSREPKILQVWKWIGI